MHICFIAIDFHINNAGGGIASYVQSIGKKLVEAGHRVSVIAKGNTKEWRMVDGLQVFFYPLGNLSWYWYRAHLPKQVILPLREVEWSLGILQALRTVHKEEPIDLIEGCETGNLFVHHLKIPYLIRLHGEPYVFSKYSGQHLHMGMRVNRKLEFLALKRASGVTSPSRFQADEVAQGLGWSQNRIHVIPNPINPAILELAQKHQRKNSHHDSPIVLYTGRIEYRKGTIPLLRSIPYVARKIPDVRFVIAGGRHNSIDDSTLDKVVEENHIKDHVSFLGHIPWDELAAWYRQASIFVMPSFYETFGISVIEAMVFSLPVVATTAGGLPEVVEEGITGILVRPGDHQALSEAIIQLLNDTKLCQHMGTTGKQRVLEKFTVEQTFIQTFEVYRECMKGKHF